MRNTTFFFQKCFFCVPVYVPFLFPIHLFFRVEISPGVASKPRFLILFLSRNKMGTFRGTWLAISEEQILTINLAVNSMQRPKKTEDKHRSGTWRGTNFTQHPARLRTRPTQKQEQARKISGTNSGTTSLAVAPTNHVVHRIRTYLEYNRPLTENKYLLIRANFSFSGTR